MGLRPSPGRRAEREPVVVIGAGDEAAQLVSAMLCDADCSWRPVALVDDPYKRHRRLSGVPVVGESHEFPQVAETYGRNRDHGRAERIGGDGAGVQPDGEPGGSSSRSCRASTMVKDGKVISTGERKPSGRGGLA